MSEREPQPLPDWAEQERAGDLGWIRENLDTFWPMAQLGYQAVGRGAVIVDTTVTVVHSKGVGHLVGYFDQAALKDLADEDTRRLVDAYGPREEFVATLIKPQDRISSYRLRVIGEPGKGQESQAEQTPAAASAPAPEQPPDQEVELEPPDIETLMEWEAEGGCEAACPHHCWTEPDGTCEHGKPSWLIVMGLI